MDPNRSRSEVKSEEISSDNIAVILNSFFMLEAYSRLDDGDGSE